VKTVNLLLWHEIQVLILMTGAFLVSLSLLKVGMLDCMGKDANPLCQTAYGGVGLGIFMSCVSLVLWVVCCRQISEVVSPES
jgi:hypothetical protein